MKKVQGVLLVDDSKATNFFNKTILQKSELVQEISVAENGKQALEHIAAGNVPEVIFLDINMPVMDGWEFLEAYQKLSADLKKSTIVVMLGTPLPERDRDKALSYPQVIGFREKMLTKSIFSILLDQMSELGFIKKIKQS